jgi:hypothetical protein
MKAALKILAGVIGLYALAALLAYGVAKADCHNVSTLGVSKEGQLFSTFLTFPEEYGYRFCFVYFEESRTVCVSMTDKPFKLKSGVQVGTMLAEHAVTTEQLEVCAREETT